MQPLSAIGRLFSVFRRRPCKNGHLFAQIRNLHPAAGPFWYYFFSFFIACLCFRMYEIQIAYIINNGLILNRLRIILTHYRFFFNLNFSFRAINMSIFHGESAFSPHDHQASVCTCMLHALSLIHI